MVSKDKEFKKACGVLKSNSYYNHMSELSSITKKELATKSVRIYVKDVLVSHLVSLYEKQGKCKRIILSLVESCFDD